MFIHICSLSISNCSTWKHCRLVPRRLHESTSPLYFSLLRRAATASTRSTPTDRRPTLSSTTTSATPLTTTPGGASRKAYPGHRPTATPSPSRATRSTAPRRRCLLYLHCHHSSVRPAPSLSRPRVNPRVRAACSGPKAAGLPPPPSRAPTPPASTAPSTGPPAA